MTRLWKKDWRLYKKCAPRHTSFKRVLYVVVEFIGYLETYLNLVNFFPSDKNYNNDNYAYNPISNSVDLYI